MNFDAIANAIKDFMAQPIPIIGVTVGSVLAFVLTVLSKTTIGKKSLNKLKAMYDNLVKNYNDLKQEYENYKNNSAELIEALQLKHKEKEEVLDLKYEELYDFTTNVASNINNVKIKQELAVIQAKHTLSDNEYIEAKIEEQVNNKYDEFLKQYEAKFDQALLKYENNKGITLENGEEE